MSKVGRYSHVAKENPVYIVGQQHKLNQKNHAKLKRERDKELEQLRSWRESFGLGNPPILIYAPQTLGAGVPAGSPVQTPKEFAHALIRLTAARPVADFSIEPVLVITEDELLGQDVQSRDANA